MKNMDSANRNVLEFMKIGKIRLDIFEYPDSFEVIAKVGRCSYIARGTDRWETINKAFVRVAQLHREIEEELN
ncbi:hypothetical protein H4O14_02000 [Bacillus sp. PAMC26568]|nr:hypothetical protein H4O14_02000 [Bacillus sp. PAMC26568]